MNVSATLADKKKWIAETVMLEWVEFAAEWMWKVCGERRNQIGSVEARLAESTTGHAVNRKQARKKTQRVVELQGI